MTLEWVETEQTMNHQENAHKIIKNLKPDYCLDCGALKFWFDRNLYHYDGELKLFNQTECLPF